MPSDIPPLAAGPPPARKKRRWWIYLLIGFGTVAALALAGFLWLVGYYHSLIKTYTENAPQPLATVDASPAVQEQLKAKWTTFVQSVSAGQPTPPINLSAAELNVAIAGISQLKDAVRLQMRDGKLQANYAFSLDPTKRPELKGKYLNGLVTLDLKLEDGFLTLHVVSMEVNRHPVPNWILSKVKKENLLQMLENNHEIVDFLQKIERVEVQDDNVIFTPATAK